MLGTEEKPKLFRLVEPEAPLPSRMTIGEALLEGSGFRGGFFLLLASCPFPDGFRSGSVASGEAPFDFSLSGSFCIWCWGGRNMNMIAGKKIKQTYSVVAYQRSAVSVLTRILHSESLFTKHNNKDSVGTAQ